MARLKSLLVALPFASFLACGSGSPGDLNHIDAGPIVLGTPIADANNPTTRANANATVNARAVVVVAVDNFDETNDGKSIGNIYVEDPIQPTPWSGITLFRATTTPSNLFLVSGDGVTMSGVYSPYAGPTSSPFPTGIVLPEIDSGALSLAYEGSSPTPVDITIADLSNTANGMQYVGMLVRIKNVTLTAQGITGERLTGSISPDGTSFVAGELYDITPTFAPYAGKATTFTSITGLLDYFYTFSLCPRTPADVVK